jgi:hypothetical protein
MAVKDYKSLSTTDQVRVNAVIIQALETNAHDFVPKFREQVIANAVNGDRMPGFQTSLDNLRDYLATDIKKLPKVKENGVDDQNDLNGQRVLLRNIQNVMGKSESVNSVFTAKQIGDMVAKQKNHYLDNETYRLPDPATPYAGAKDMLVNAASLAGCKKLGGSLDHCTKIENGAPVTPASHEKSVKQR